MILRGILLILAANILGGLSYLGQDVCLRSLPPASIAFGRNLIAFMLALSWAMLYKDKNTKFWPFGIGDSLRLACIGFFAFGLPVLLGLYGQQRSTAGNASVLILLEPVGILIFARILLKEHCSKQKWLGILLGVLGAIGVATGGEDSLKAISLFNSQQLLGNLMLIAGALCWGLYTPLFKPIASRHSSNQMTWAIIMFSLIPLFPLAMMEYSAGKIDFNHPQMSNSLIALLLIAFGATFLGTFLWNASLRYLQAATIAPFIFLQPIVGLVGDYLMSGNALSSKEFLGSLLIFGSVGLVIFEGKKKSD